MPAGRKFDLGKLRFDLIPSQIEEALAVVLTYGADKYSPDNWKDVDDFENRYYGALRRHLSAWRQGEDYDLDEPGFNPETYKPGNNEPAPGSHILHIVQVFINAGFLTWHSIIKRGLKIRLSGEEIENLRKQN